VLEIPRQSVEQVRLSIPQPGGRTALLAHGRLGAYQDQKVIKLLTPPDRRVVAHINRALRPGAGAPAPQPAPARTQAEAAAEAEAEGPDATADQLPG